jgi:hypothetical protein
MPRRSKPKVQKRDWRWYASFGLNAAVALSMVLGTVILFTGGSIVPRQAAPTVAPTTNLSSSVIPTPTPPASTTPEAQPTSAPATPNPAPPSPTPKASAHNYPLAPSHGVN